MVEVTIGGCCQLQCPEADVIKSLVINAESLVRVFNKLVYREGSVVRLEMYEPVRVIVI